MRDGWENNAAHLHPNIQESCNLIPSGVVAMSDPVDLLFIHVPRFTSYYKPYGEYMTVNLIPMGTFALADLALRRGYRTEILHLGLEWIETGAFSPLNYLEKNNVQVVAISLNWHQQSYDVMKVAEQIKRERPGTYIVLGGCTASFFHEEILENFPQIDTVIRGDAEVPLMALMAAVKKGKVLQEIPNLSWRAGDEIRNNPLSYVASGDDLDDVSYANLNLLKGKDTYIRYMGLPFVWAKGLSREVNRKYFHLGHPIFFLNIGRGCLGNCTWCGGGEEAQRIVNGRSGVVFRRPERVVDTVAEAVESGYKAIHIAFDPGKEGERYYRELFPLLKGFKVRCYFESFSLPSEDFLKEFAETFVQDGSVIAISPETGDERVRYRNKSFSFSNEALMKTISLAEKIGIKVDIFFSMGIPGEKYRDLAKTCSLRGEIKKRFKNIGRMWTAPITLEPASPWYLHPEEFGIVSTRRSFADFYQASSPGGGGIGYYIPDYSGDGRELDAEEFEMLLKRTKCRDHCSLHINPSKGSSPFWGRMSCRYLNWRFGGARG
jgi:radical SAM superfamily enzyme YgiQ (UPF0313 family)